MNINRVTASKVAVMIAVTTVHRAVTLVTVPATLVAEGRAMMTAAAMATVAMTSAVVNAATVVEASLKSAISPARLCRRQPVAPQPAFALTVPLLMARTARFL